jgi:predicted HAD superfamily Cof-like phosphohydrolase
MGAGDNYVDDIIETMGTAELPTPEPNDSKGIWDIVIEDMKARDTVGRERYGTPLQAGNGRDALLDAYQESLDQTVYLRKELEERWMRDLPREPGEAWVDEVGQRWTFRSHDGPGAFRFERDTGGGYVAACGVSAGDAAPQIANRIERWRRVVPALPHRETMAAEIRRLQAREQELLETNTRLVEALRKTDRKRMVREFFIIANQKIGDLPRELSDDQARFRARLNIEEGAKELLKAMFEVDKGPEPWRFDRGINDLFWVINNCAVKIDMVDLVDATIDTDYVTEGLRVALGVDSTPFWEEVQKKNLEKAGGPRREDGKLLKPPGWTPPDIEGLLVKQGWVRPAGAQ